MRISCWYYIIHNIWKSGVLLHKAVANYNPRDLEPSPVVLKDNWQKVSVGIIAYFAVSKHECPWYYISDSNALPGT